jgi:hypothetical protein
MRKAKSKWLLTGVPPMGFLYLGIGPAGAKEGEPLNQGGA